MAERREQVFVQALFAHATVKAFDQAVLHGLAWRDVVPTDLAVLLPFEHRVGGQLRPVTPSECSCFRGYDCLRSPQVAQQVIIAGSQVPTVVLHNHTARETDYDRYDYCTGRACFGGD